MLFDLIRSRRSIRLYQPTPVSHERIEVLMDAARWGPSAHNRQPWRFAVVQAPAIKHALATAMGEQLRADLERDGAPRERIEADVARSHARINCAPVLVVVCMTMRDMDRYRDAERQHAEWTMATQSVAMAVQNLLLAAHALGLGACWLCAPLFAPDVVRKVLSLADDWQPQALVTVGYPAETKTKTRAPLAALVKYVDDADEKEGASGCP
jgi:F420 biosynthesis protein FbiB-like protein